MKAKVSLYRRIDKETSSVLEKETDNPIRYLIDERKINQNEYIELKIGNGIPNTPFMIIEIVNVEMLNEDDLKEIIKCCEDMNEKLKEKFKEKETEYLSLLK